MRETNLLKWLVIHNHPWNKCMCWNKLRGFFSILQSKLYIVTCIKY